MADRFWVGGSGAWDETNTANWSTTPGGAGGASVPTGTDDVYFGSWSGAGAVNIGGNSVAVNCGALYCELGYEGTFTSIGYGLYIHRGLRLTASMIVSNFTAVFFADLGGAYTIDLAGCTITRLLTTSGGTSTYTAASDIRTVAEVSLVCSFDLAGFNVYARYVQCAGGSGTLNFGSSTIYIASTTSAPFRITGSGYTLLLGNASVVIEHISTPSKILTLPSGTTLGAVTLVGPPYSLNITVGANTFKTIVAGVGHTIRFPAGLTTTVQNFAVTGSAEGQATVTSTSTATANLVYAGSGVVSTNYLNVSKINATPAATWYIGKNSVDGGNNTGLIFDYPPSPNGGLLFGSNF